MGQWVILHRSQEDNVLRNFEKIANNIICGLIVPEKPLWGFNNKVCMYVCI